MAKSDMQRSNYWTYGICAVLIAAGGVAFQVGAQNPNEPRTGIAGLPTVKPVAPPTTPRPLQTPDKPYDTSRGGDDEPISSFIESLKSTDAAFQVLLGQSRMFTTREPIAKDDGVATIAVSDPSVLDFEVLPNPKMIRLIGRRAGVTDLTFTTADDKTYSFEVHVTYDLELVRAQLRQLFPDSNVRLGQLREHLIVEGQARSTDQVQRITQFLEAYLESVQVVQRQQNQNARGAPGQGPAGPVPAPGTPDAAGAPTDGAPADGALAPAPADPANPFADDPGANPDGAPRALSGDNRPSGNVTVPRARLINLLTVPGVQQVLLQVQIAELNRTALREIGVDWLARTPNAVIGTQIAGSGLATGVAPASTTTAFAIFPSGELSFMIRALRRNSVLNVLAEPNLVALHGQEASFLAGGEFAVPVPQVGGGGGVAALTVEFKTFGVNLNFVPYILDDETIRLRVAPEASTIDEAVGTEIAGTVVPGISTRRVNTTVELKQGQTLALAGLLTVEMDGQTSRIPLLGDLPYIGTMFSNTSHRRQEKELVVLVTPHLVAPMNPGQVPCVPGDDLQAPNDLEFYLLGRIEGRTGKPFPVTTAWDNALGFVQLMKLERSHLCGPFGYSEDDE